MSAVSANRWYGAVGGFHPCGSEIDIWPLLGRRLALVM